MVTERLYYSDSFLREFDAKVLACEPGGERWRVRLDRTAFYPTSGGQPHDIGRLKDAAVLDVVERNDHEIIHITDRAVAAGAVHGAIDWDRRFDHMQQHTGQHLLSAAFIELFKFPTVSFHLGRDSSTIDLEARSVVPRHLEEVERHVNRVIFEDRPISASFATAQQLAASGVRKAVAREGLLRVIEIEGFDRQPCGGTHLARTGQAGLLLIRKCEKQKQNWRVEFVCGFRALAAARDDFAALGAAAEQLSCGLPEVPTMVGKTIEERRTTQRVAKQVQERVAKYEADFLLAEGAQVRADGTRVVLAILEDAEPSYLGMLAARLIAQPRVQALLATRAGGAVVFAQSEGLPADMGALLRETLVRAGGKGGGTKQFAQGSVADPSKLEEILGRAKDQLANKRV